MLTPDGCRSRQHWLDALRLDAAVLTDYRDVYYYRAPRLSLSANHPRCLWTRLTSFDHEPSAQSSSRPHTGHGDWPWPTTWPQW